MAHPAGGAGGEYGAAGTQLFHQRGRPHLHIAENAGQAFRRGGGVNDHGDAVVMTGGETAPLRQRGGASHHKVSRRQIEIAPAPPVFYAALQAVMNLKAFSGAAPVFTAGVGVNVPVDQLHAGKYRVMCFGGFSAGRLQPQQMGIGRAAAEGRLGTGRKTGGIHGCLLSGKIKVQEL